MIPPFNRGQLWVSPNVLPDLDPLAQSVLYL